MPVLAVGVVAALQFNPSNFHAGGGFMPFGFHGVFAALTGGVVFGLQGFEQAVQLAGEARDPEARSVARDPHRDGDRRRALHAAAGRDDRRRSTRPTSSRAGRCRSAPIRPTTASGTRSRSRWARAGSPRCCSSTRSSHRRAPASSTWRPRPGSRTRSARSAEMPSALATTTEGRAGRLHPHGGRRRLRWRSDRSRAGTRSSAW